MGFSSRACRHRRSVPNPIRRGVGAASSALALQRRGMVTTTTTTRTTTTTTPRDDRRAPFSHVAIAIPPPRTTNTNTNEHALSMRMRMRVRMGMLPQQRTHNPLVSAQQQQQQAQLFHTTTSTSRSPFSSPSSALLSSASSSHSTATENTTTTTTTTTEDDESEQQPATATAAVVYEREEEEEEDTIFALSSGFTGERATAVAVIRISGPRATTVLGELLTKPSPPNHKTTTTGGGSKHKPHNNNNKPAPPPRLPKYREAALRKLYHPVDGSVLDFALVLSFRGPNSFTGENLVELQCHGSRVIVERLLTEALPALGCRMAEPGEFTQRAFARGKLDLVQVEALADILAAETRTQVEQGLKHLDGDVSKTYEDWRSQLVSGLAHAEAVIDFGDDEHLLPQQPQQVVGGGENENDDADYDYNSDYDYDYGLSDESLQEQQDSVWGEVGTKMMQLKRSMEDNLEDGRRGELIREGIKVAIIGPPNAGKSSLFNLLARRDAAIVSPIAGTTRDVLQVSMDLGGVKCTLQDTAGVRSDTTDVLELEGMKRAKTVIKEADLVVAMIDVTEASHGMDIVRSVLEDCDLLGGDGDEEDEENDSTSASATRRMMLVRNKNDLLQETATSPPPPPAAAVDAQQTQQLAQFEFGDDNNDRIFDISCQSQEGIDAFLNALTEEVVARTRGNADEKGTGEGALITRARHRQHVEAAVEALERFGIMSAEGSMAVDMAAEELRLAASELGRITGAVDVEDVLDVLFSDFCIGK